MNANLGTARGMEMLETALAELGWGGAITVDAENHIIGGNKSAEKAMERGFRLRIVDVAPDEAIAIRRSDLRLYDEDDPRGRDLATALNRVAETNLHWSDTMLQAAAERQGARAREQFWFPNERQGLATAEAKADARAADAADADAKPLDITPRKATTRRVVIVTCRNENDVADLAEWLESRGIAWREA